MKRLVCIGIAVLLLGGCSASPRQCEFKVSGSAKEAMITYMVGTSQNQTTESLPWSHKFEMTDQYQPMSLSAQNQGTTGTIKVDILVDGKSVKSGSASNEYGVATAAATLSEI